MKDLAILIPVYNDSGAVRTLDSICERDNSFTVIVVDDGSQNPIRVDSARYPFRVHVLRQESNGGIVKALNAGLDFIRSKGFRFVARLDAADLNHPERFRIEYDHLKANADLAMVGSNVVFRCEETDQILFATNLPLSPGAVRRWMVFRNGFIHPSVMLRAEVLKTVGSYGSRFPHIEDYVFFSKIVDRFPCENLNEQLVDCYVRECGISRSNERSQLLAGIRFKLSQPKPFNALWYAVLLKRLCYVVTPLKVRIRLKQWLGFVTMPALDRKRASQPHHPIEILREASNEREPASKEEALN